MTLLLLCDTADVASKTHYASKVLGPLAMVAAAVFSPFNSVFQTLALVLSSDLSTVLLVEGARMLYTQRELKVFTRAIDEANITELQQYQEKPWPEAYVVPFDFAERAVHSIERRKTK